MADKTPAIQDLDVLRPPPEYVRLAGKDIDISFIPSGVAIDIMELQDSINDMVDTPAKMAKVREGGEVALRTFDLSAELCAKVTMCQFPEMDKAWLLKNTSVGQLKILVERVTRAVFRSLETVEDTGSKKPLATEKPSP